MEPTKNANIETDPEAFGEDEKPWRPEDNDIVDPPVMEPVNRVSQEGPLDMESDPVDEALEDVLGEGDSPDEAPEPETVEEVAEEPAEESVEASDLEISASSVAEAVLFSADEPVTPNKLAAIVGVGGVKEIRGIVEALNAKYENMGCAFRIESIAGGLQMLTLPEYNVWLKKLIKVRGETKLSPAALETLAIIAYKQPIMRVDIESVRGVAAGEMVRQLIDKGLVKITGRAEELGRPLLYGTTQKFLEAFGLGNLKDLPSDEDLKQGNL